MGFRLLNTGDAVKVADYLEMMDEESRRYFAPHGRQPEEVHAFLSDLRNRAWGFEDTETGSLAAYAIVRLGGLPHDTRRFSRYGFVPDPRIDGAFAPSVLAVWRGKGLARLLWQQVLADALEQGCHRIFLWGGVKVDNLRAVSYYERLGFIPIGGFYHEGENIDMVYMVRGGNPVKL